MNAELERLRHTEIWIAWVRVFAVPFAAFEVAVVGDRHPPGYERWGWATAVALTLGAVAFFWLARRDLDRKALGRIGFLALAFDTAIVYAFVFVYTFEPSTPAWGILYIPVIEGALRYGKKGGVLVPIVVLPLVFLAEWWRAQEFGPPPFDLDHVTLPFGLQIVIGLVVGWLVDRLRAETAVAEARAAEAEDLRDRLGHRADVLEAVNRAARALASSLDQREAFAAFRRELRQLDRLRPARDRAGGRVRFGVRDGRRVPRRRGRGGGHRAARAHRPRSRDAHGRPRRRARVHLGGGRDGDAPRDAR